MVRTPAAEKNPRHCPKAHRYRGSIQQSGTNYTKLSLTQNDREFNTESTTEPRERKVQLRMARPRAIAPGFVQYFGVVSISSRATILRSTTRGARKVDDSKTIEHRMKTLHILEVSGLGHTAHGSVDLQRSYFQRLKPASSPSH